MVGVKGMVNTPRNDCRVFVPVDTLASKVSAPPKTLRIREEADYIQLLVSKQTKIELDTHSAALIIAQFCRTRQ
jgi:hypothetical protein